MLVVTVYELPGAMLVWGGMLIACGPVPVLEEEIELEIKGRLEETAEDMATLDCGGIKILDELLREELLIALLGIVIELPMNMELETNALLITRGLEDEEGKRAELIIWTEDTGGAELTTDTMEERGTPCPKFCIIRLGLPLVAICS